MPMALLKTGAVQSGRVWITFSHSIEGPAPQVQKLESARFSASVLKSPKLRAKRTDW